MSQGCTLRGRDLTDIQPDQLPSESESSAGPGGGFLSLFGVRAGPEGSSRSLERPAFLRASFVVRLDSMDHRLGGKARRQRKQAKRKCQLACGQGAPWS